MVDLLPNKTQEQHELIKLTEKDDYVTDATDGSLRYKSSHNLHFTLHIIIYLIHLTYLSIN